MAPLLYAVFIDDLLQDPSSSCADNGVHLQTRPVARTLTSLKAMRATLWGFLCGGSACSKSSTWCIRWQWDADVKKSHVFNPKPNVSAHAVTGGPLWQPTHATVYWYMVLGTQGTADSAICEVLGHLMQ
jgi:hypothetical protein